MTKEELAYQCAYDLSNDWATDNPTWEDVQKAFLIGFKTACDRAYKNYKKHGKLKEFKEIMEQ